MNEAHQHCGSDEWRAMIRDVILPWALGNTDLGDDVLEVGPGYGATTDVLSQSVPRLTSVEIDDELAAVLAGRFAGVPSVEIVRGDATSLAYADDRFSGAACFTMLHHVATNELQDRLFSEIARVLRPGAPLVASDSLASDELEAHHEGDTYNPVDAARSAGGGRLRACRGARKSVRLGGRRADGDKLVLKKVCEVRVVVAPTCDRRPTGAAITPGKRHDHLRHRREHPHDRLRMGVQPARSARTRGPLRLRHYGPDRDGWRRK